MALILQHSIGRLDAKMSELCHMHHLLKHGDTTTHAHMRTLSNLTVKLTIKAGQNLKEVVWRTRESLSELQNGRNSEPSSNHRVDMPSIV